MKHRIYFINVIVILALALAMWLSWTSHQINTPIKKTTKQSPDAFMIGAEISQYASDGSLNFTLDSPKLNHYTEKNTTDIDNPNILILNESGQKWHIVARQGEALEGLEHILLWDSVEMRGTPNGGTKDIHLFSEKMNYYPSKHFAETDKNVRITQNDSTVDATGMEIDFDTNIARLLSNVRGQYDPNK